MSRFLSKSAASVKPYTPGEQPRGQTFIKLNTNENPYPPPPSVLEAISAVRAGDFRLYPDPASTEFRNVVAERYKVRPEQVFAGCGSDEVLAFAFMAFFDRGDRVCFPDVTYGFYSVYANLFGLEKVEIPLGGDYAINIADYFGLDCNIFIANPNAPTGLALSRDQIEAILKANPDRLLVVDEAYIDFSDVQSSVELIDKYDNLLVVQTFSKSRSLAGMRLGLGFGHPELMAALERIKFSFSPYNIDRAALAGGVASIKEREYTDAKIRQIILTRAQTIKALEAAGYEILPSGANFIFLKGALPGAQLCAKLREDGILVRHFDGPRTKDYLRITIGLDSEMDALIDCMVRYTKG
ncbi:MAG: histidinol-phosphate transaminase [Oscillospiraceae bacterium]|nr:histidinol-phosphate transaminase [Oscillospiraceae bacterium]